ncbi:TPA: hypothetical protein I7683_21895 [Vibrio vulnificus]|nr:hypothetical protein [Vibrio vulnificus]
MNCLHPLELAFKRQRFNRSETANKAFKSDSQRLAVSLRSSIAKRCSHLNAALCLITQSQWFMVFHCSLGFSVLCLSASWLF